MEGIKTNIPANLLVGYVMTHEVAWQICDSLMEFSHIGQTRADIEEKEVQNKGLITILESGQSCKVFNPKSDQYGGFEDLVEWSNEDDLLILVDNELMLCIAACDKTKVLTM